MPQATCRLISQLWMLLRLEWLPGFTTLQPVAAPIATVNWAVGTRISNSFFVDTPAVPGTYRVRASINGLAATSSAVTVYATPELAFNKTAVNVGRGFRTYLTELAINRRVAGTPVPLSEPVIVNLSSSDPSRVTVPATITIPSGASTATFAVTGVEFTGGSPVTITASAANYQAPASALLVSVVPPAFALCNVDAYRVLASPRDLAHICGTLQPGSAYADVVAANTMADLSIVEASPAGIISGIYSEFSGPDAPISQVVWQAGSSTSSNFYVGTPTAIGSYKVRASLGGQAVTSNATAVVEPELRFSRTQLNVGKGFETHPFAPEITIARHVGAGVLALSENTQVTFSSSDPAKVAAPSPVTILNGSFSASVIVSGLELTAGTPVTIDALATGHRSPIARLQVSVVNGVIRFCDLLTSREVSAERDQTTVCGGVQAGSVYSEVPSNLQSVSLSVVDANPAGIVTGLFNLPALGTQINSILWQPRLETSFSFYVGSPTTNGTYRLSASISGGPSALSPVITVGGGSFGFKRADFSTYTALGVQKSFRTGGPEIGIERQGNVSAPLTVTLRCVSVVICRVQPSTLSWGANQNSLAHFSVDGLELGSTLIEASDGASIVTYPVTVNRLNAYLAFQQLPATIPSATTRTTYVFTFTQNANFGQSLIGDFRL